MKRVLSIITLMLLVATLWAQSDSTITSGIAQDDTSIYDDVVYKAPNRNPIYYFGSPFASHFAELDFMIGNDLGAGITYTYLPEVWGGHITGIAGFTARWLLVGTDYRLSKPWTKSDWHMYGSIGYRHGTNNGTLLGTANRENIGFRPALEAGFRYGNIPHRGSFCMNSFKVGVLTDFQDIYVTLGFSFSIALLASTFFLLGLSY